MSRFARLLDTADERELRAYVRDVAYRFVFGSFIWEPVSVPANNEATTTFTTSTSAAFADLRRGMVVCVTPPAGLATGLGVSAAWVPADSQLSVRLSNHTGGDLAPAIGEWVFLAFLT